MSSIGKAFVALLKSRQSALDEAKATIEALENHIKHRAELVNIETRGRVNRFTFLRNGEAVVIETYSTMSDDVPGWKRRLFG